MSTTATKPSQAEEVQQRPLASAFATMLEASAAPYGYTIAIWSSGALLIHYRTAPDVGEVFLFVAGAVVGFTLLGLVGRRAVETAKALGQGPARVWAGILDWFAVGLAVGAVALLAQIESWVAWPLGSFSATTVYFAAASLQLGLAVRRSRQS